MRWALCVLPLTRWALCVLPLGSSTHFLAIIKAVVSTLTRVAGLHERLALCVMPFCWCQSRTKLLISPANRMSFPPPPFPHSVDLPAPPLQAYWRRQPEPPVIAKSMLLLYRGPEHWGASMRSGHGGESWPTQTVQPTHPPKDWLAGCAASSKVSLHLPPKQNVAKAAAWRQQK